VVVRESKVGCSQVVLQPYNQRVIAAVANNDTCETWHFSYLGTDGQIKRNYAPDLQLVVTRLAVSPSGDLIASGPSNANFVFESIFMFISASSSWKQVDVGMANFVVQSMTYCNARQGAFIDVVDVQTYNRTLLLYSPSTETLRTVLNDATLVKPGVVAGIAQLSSGGTNNNSSNNNNNKHARFDACDTNQMHTCGFGCLLCHVNIEIAVAGKFTYAGSEQFRNAAVLKGSNDWSSLEFTFPPGASSPDSAVGLAAVDNTFYTAGGGSITLLKDAPLPLYSRSLSSKWELLPNTPTSLRDSNRPSLEVVAAFGDTVYFGGLLNAMVGSAEAVGAISYNTKTKTWASFGIPRDSFTGTVTTIVAFDSKYVAFGGPFDFTIGQDNYRGIAVYNGTSGTFIPPTAALTGINHVYAFGYHEPTNKGFLFGNLVVCCLFACWCSGVAARLLLIAADTRLSVDRVKPHRSIPLEL
jgi:hypothetical protein